MTGFHKRKQERRKHWAEKEALKAREEKRANRKEKQKERSEAIANLVARMEEIEDKDKSVGRDESGSDQEQHDKGLVLPSLGDIEGVKESTRVFAGASVVTTIVGGDALQQIEKEKWKQLKQKKKLLA